METGITSLGLLFVPLGVVCFFMGREALGALLIAASVFQAGAVLNTDVLGPTVSIAPYYWVTVVCAARLAADFVFLRLEIHAAPSVRRAMALLALFAAVGTAGAVVLPSWFQGIGVYDPRSGLDSQYFNWSSLGWSVSNLAQVSYLWLNTLMAFYFCTSITEEATARRYVAWMHRGGFIVIFFGYYQLFSHYFKLYFPARLLYSAEAWSQGFYQQLADVKRINSTFTEPSNLSAYLISYLAFAAIFLLEGRGGFRMALGLLLGLPLLLMTTSATAYATLAAVLLAFGLRFLAYPLLVKYRLVKGILVGAFLMLTIFFVMSQFVRSSTFVNVMRSAVLEKMHSSSYTHRMAADQRAVDLLLLTWGMGVGLGSNRPSSFVAWVASNTGLPGFVLFSGSLGVLFAAGVRTGTSLQATPWQRTAASACLWGLGAHLVAKALSQPDLAFPTLWVWILLLGCCVNAGDPSVRKRASCRTSASTPWF